MTDVLQLYLTTEPLFLSFQYAWHFEKCCFEEVIILGVFAFKKDFLLAGGLCQILCFYSLSHI